MKDYKDIINKLTNGVIWELNRRWDNIYSVKTHGINAWDWYTISIETGDDTDRKEIEDDINEIIDKRLCLLPVVDKTLLLDEYFDMDYIKKTINDTLTKKRFEHVDLKKIQERLY